MFPKTHADYLQTEKDVRIFYNSNFVPGKKKGNLPLIVFNYGLVCNFTHYKKQLPYFDKEGYPVIIHNYRAHFNSTGSVESYNFKNCASDIKKLIDHTGYKKVLMVGHSMGVNVTLEFARLYPEYLLGMVLMSGSVFSPKNIMFNNGIMGKIIPYIEAFAHDYPDLYNRFWKNSYLNPLMKRIVHFGGFNTEIVSQDFVEHYMKRIGELPPELFYHLLQQMHEHDVGKDLKKIKTKTLVVGGDKDLVIPFPFQLDLKNRLPNADLYIIKDGSHVPQLDFPETLNERLSLFFKKQIEREA